MIGEKTRIIRLICKQCGAVREIVSGKRDAPCPKCGAKQSEPIKLGVITK